MDKFNPYEDDFGPAPVGEEIGIMIPLSDIIHMLNKPVEEKPEHVCPYCKLPITLYKDNLYFCRVHNFIMLGGEDGRIT